MSHQITRADLTMVDKVANRFHGRHSIGYRFELDDLRGWGRLGLVQAARSYKGGQGATFATWAYRRISGATLDGMRSSGVFGRSDMRRFKRDGTTFTRVPLEAAHAVSAPEYPLVDVLAARAAVSSLSRADRKLLRRRYLDGVVLDQVGCGSKSLACRVHARIMATLAAQFTETRP